MRVFICILLVAVMGLAHAVGSAEGSFKKGVAFLEEDNLSAAIHQFKQALAANPKHKPSLFHLGECYELQESWSEAAATYEKLEKLDPNDTKILLLYLHALERSGSTDKQMGILKTLHHKDKKDIVIAIKYLKILEKNGVKTSHPRYIAVLEDLSELPGSHVLFADLLGDSQRQETLKQDARRDAKINSKMEFRQNLSKITKGQKIKIDTSAYQQKLMGEITKYPDDNLLLEAQGRLYFEQKKYTQAKIFLNNIQSPSPEVLGLLGQIYMTRENYPKAISKFEQIAEKDFTQPVWENYIDALVSHNQKDRAKKEAEALFKKYPASKKRMQKLVQ